jgi:hypothetical protein
MLKSREARGAAVWSAAGPWPMMGNGWLGWIWAGCGLAGWPAHTPVGRYLATRRAVAPPRVSTTTRLACTLCAVRTCTQAAGAGGASSGGRRRVFSCRCPREERAEVQHHTQRQPSQPKRGD